MTIAFTLCSNNFLAHAKTLGDSFIEHHPDCKFIIGLVDKFNDSFDYAPYSKFQIIPVEILRIEGFNEINDAYDVKELNTAVKPSYFNYIFNNYEVDNVFYIDPDILIESRFEELFVLLETNNIIVTPHMLSPIDDEFIPSDFEILKTGIFNLGFLALSNYNKIKSFLDWWHQRVIKYGFGDLSRGMFYDQLLTNYVPAFFDNYYILKHPGYNMATWNLHERVLSTSDDKKFVVNNKFPLRFFHFSSFNYTKPQQISSYSNRFSFENRPDLIEIFELYNQRLIANGIKEISQLPVFYYPAKEPPVKVHISFQYRLLKRLTRSFNVLIKGYE